MRSRLSTLAAAIISLALSIPARGAFLRDVPVTVVQPDGVPLLLYATGDELGRAITDRRGYRVGLDADGWPVYAKVRAGRLMLTSARVRDTDPGSLRSWLRGIRRDLSPAVAEYATARGTPYRTPAPALASTGPRTVQNLVVFVRFAGESEFARPLAHYDGLHNTGFPSLGDYYTTVSAGEVGVASTFYPAAPGSNVLSYQDSHERGYYQPRTAQNPDGYRSDMEIVSREQSLVARAVNAIAPQVPAGLDLDTDGDGMVDSVELIVSGQPDGWSDLLWPHRWVLYAANASIRGVPVWGFTFQLDGVLDVSVLAHEMGHALGAPDLYRYPDCSSAYRVYPVYEWDLMAHNLEGAPQWPLSVTRWRYLGMGTEPATLMGSAVLTLAPHEAVQLYAGGDERVYLECRVQDDYDAGLPSYGLLAYRVDLGVEDGNRCGPPDAVYVYRPGSFSPTVQGSPQSAPLNESRDTMADPWLGNGAALTVRFYGVTVDESGCTFGIHWPSLGPTIPRIVIPRKPEGT